MNTPTWRGGSCAGSGRSLSDADGGYAASQDADVGLDDDGNYFTWTREEAAAELTPEEMDVASAYYDIGTAGEMHHDPSRNVLFVADSTRRDRHAEPAATSMTPSGCSTRRRSKLGAARARRPAPFVDRTRYTNWNAMMAAALLRAGEVLGDEWAATHATQTLARIRPESDEPDAVAPHAGRQWRHCSTTRCRSRRPHSTPARRPATVAGSTGRSG